MRLRPAAYGKTTTSLCQWYPPPSAPIKDMVRDTAVNAQASHSTPYGPTSSISFLANPVDQCSRSIKNVLCTSCIRATALIEGRIASSNETPSSAFPAKAGGRGSMRCVGREKCLFTRFPTCSSSMSLLNGGVLAQKKTGRSIVRPESVLPPPPMRATLRERRIPVPTRTCRHPSSAVLPFDRCARGVDPRTRGDPRFHCLPHRPRWRAAHGRPNGGTAAPGTRRKTASR
mmetsp:Transcript_1956/g.12323  ORF Transcript_1956/g.12323 Transcript_1956/m.12323 type:complete len:230 (-) Transcript_1956:1015-1704(-)